MALSHSVCVYVCVCERIELNDDAVNEMNTILSQVCYQIYQHHSTLLIHIGRDTF